MSNQMIVVLLIVLLVVAIIAAVVRACLKDKKESECVDAVWQYLPKKVIFYEVDVVYHDHRHERLSVVRMLDESPQFFCVRLHSGATHWIDKKYVRSVWQKEAGFLYE